MMATSPMMRMRTSSALKFVIATGLCGLCQESRTIDQRAVRIAAVEFWREDFVEAFHVRALHRVDIVAIEGEQSVVVGWRCAHCGSGHDGSIAGSGDLAPSPRGKQP